MPTTTDEIVRNNTACQHSICTGQSNLPSYPRVVFLDAGNICNQFCTFCQSMKAKQKPIALRPEDYEGFDWLKHVEQIFFRGIMGTCSPTSTFTTFAGRSNDKPTVAGMANSRPDCLLPAL